jgi:hypothetical protein
VAQENRGQEGNLNRPAGKHDTAVLFSCRRKNCMWRLQLVRHLLLTRHLLLIRRPYTRKL